jgi:hypothetical protein
MTDIAPSFEPIQQESVQFNQPVSESTNSAIGGLANALLQVFFPVGSIVDSMLTTAQFQALIGNPSPAIWVLADGSAVPGSAYATLTGFGNIPDLRGIFTRGKNNGATTPDNNPAGDLPLGQYQADTFAGHSHVGLFDQATNNQWGQQLYSTGVGLALLATQPAGVSSSFYTGNTGGAETSPKYVTINKFIRIN